MNVLRRISTAVSARPPHREGLSTSPTTSPTRRSASCSSRVTERGLCRIAYGRTRRARRARRRFGARVLRSRGRSTASAASSTSTSPASAASSTSQLDLSRRSGFHRQVLRELARVPFGQVTTYGARAAKSVPRAARAIGGAMNRNPIPIVLPCHRVVGSNGNLIGYAGGLDRKDSCSGSRGRYVRPSSVSSSAPLHEPGRAERPHGQPLSGRSTLSAASPPPS